MRKNLKIAMNIQSPINTPSKHPLGVLKFIKYFRKIFIISFTLHNKINILQGYSLGIYGTVFGKFWGKDL